MSLQFTQQKGSLENHRSPQRLAEHSPPGKAGVKKFVNTTGANPDSCNLPSGLPYAMQASFLKQPLFRLVLNPTPQKLPVPQGSSTRVIHLSIPSKSRTCRCEAPPRPASPAEPVLLFLFSPSAPSRLQDTKGPSEPLRPAPGRAGQLTGSLLRAAPGGCHPTGAVQLHGSPTKHLCNGKAGQDTPPVARLEALSIRYPGYRHGEARGVFREEHTDPPSHAGAAICQQRPGGGARCGVSRGGGG